MAFFNKKTKDKTKAIAAAVPEAIVVENKVVTSLPSSGDVMAYGAIIRPHQTEKAGLLAALHKYVFRVSADANQIMIKQAIEKLYKVQVVKVATLHLPGKTRRLGRQLGYRPGFKKAIITLRAGDKIDLAQ